MIRCDICGRRPAVANVPVRRGHGSGYGQEKGRTRWCRPCALAVLGRHPSSYIWAENGEWLRPDEIPA